MFGDFAEPISHGKAARVTGIYSPTNPVPIPITENRNEEELYDKFFREKNMEQEKNRKNQYQVFADRRDERWREKNDELHAEILRLNMKVQKLEGLLETEQRMNEKLDENINIRGGLERIDYAGRQQGKIGSKVSKGPRAGLTAMIKMPEFAEILHEEVEERKLVPDDIVYCIQGAYNTYSERVHGNNGHLVLRRRDHSANQIAALVVILRMQEKWANSITWTEVEEPKST
ncbi:hypothetical protein B9Z19DRAFT_1131847 [Tuber borchii]|uniref:Uncharacterized protein n=1 Tax=Tuber borchii TaxID=42251 RepID=A0A2T6ZI63_TUBBO|nr:hypothetical protein B9Z19DRAFT_1131847 [Tuber borchii]